MTHHVISGPQVYSEQGVLKETVVAVRENLIQGIFKKNRCTLKSTLRFPTTYHLLPGFIDCHVHGANMADVMDGTPEALATIAEALIKEGTTSFLATTLTAPVNEIEKALSAVQQTMQNPPKGACLLGVHLEGPFISPKKAGAQRAEFVLTPSTTLFEKWQTLCEHIKLVTLAPEIPESMGLVQFLKERHILVSMGHTDATFKEAMAAIDQGVSYATHLFNAMRGIHQREPGVVTAALLQDAVMTEVIADGIHLHPAILQCILRLKHREKIILVTDAMRAKCVTEGVYDLGGQQVTVKDNKATLADGTLAGSVLKMPNAIQNMLRYTGCHLSDASIMASENPAKALGIFPTKGSIATGKIADLVVLDEKLNVVLTMCAGEIVYQLR